MEVWRHRRREELLCRKSLVCSHSQSLHWSAEEAKPQSRTGSSAWLRKAPASVHRVGLGSSGGALMGVVYVGIRDVPLSAMGRVDLPLLPGLAAPWSQM